MDKFVQHFDLEGLHYKFMKQITEAKTEWQKLLFLANSFIITEMKTFKGRVGSQVIVVKMVNLWVR
jgi:hypothetical protein